MPRRRAPRFVAGLGLGLTALVMLHGDLDKVARVAATADYVTSRLAAARAAVAATSADPIALCHGDSGYPRRYSIYALPDRDLLQTWRAYLIIETGRTVALAQEGEDCDIRF